MDFRLEADFCNMKDEARCYYRVNKGDWLPIGTMMLMKSHKDRTKIKISVGIYSNFSLLWTLVFTTVLYSEAEEKTKHVSERRNDYEN